MSTDNDNPKQDEIDIKSIEKRIKTMKEEFSDYINKYNKLFKEISANSYEYMTLFHDMIEDLNSELNNNTILLSDIFSKMNMLGNEMPQLEELYEKVHEMKNGLDLIYKQIKKKNQYNN